MQSRYDVMVYPTVQISKDNLVTKYGRSKVTYPAFLVFSLDSRQINELRLNGHTVNPIPNPDKLQFGLGDLPKRYFDIAKKNDGKTKVYLIQFVSPIKEEWKQELIRRGVQLHGYIHPYTIFAYMPRVMALDFDSNGLRFQNEDIIRWVGQYHSSIKHEAIRYSVRPNEDVIVHYFPWSGQDNLISRHHWLSVDPYMLAARDDVIFVESQPIPRPLNNQARIVTSSNVGYAKNLIGTNQIIAITDTGIYSAHETFSQPGKIISTIDIAGDSNGGNLDGVGHGTHVACSACGDASPYLTANKLDGQGVGSKLINVKVFDNGGVWKGASEYTFWQQAYIAGARLNNNSWGASTGGTYTSSDRNADQIMVDNPDYLLLVANGNFGSASMSVGSPGVAKNVVSVGALMTNLPQDVAAFSSRGPTMDGRIKPDVLAPGASINSAQTGTVTGYTFKQGTSMATPQVTGICSMIRQYFQDGLYNGSPLTPSGILIKALLINGAQEVTGDGSDQLNEGRFPNNSQGWGLVNVARTLPFVGGLRQIRLWDNPTSPSIGTTWSQSFIVTTLSPEIKVTLTWIDSPATPGSTVSISNNLNLQVIAPDGSIFNGNNFAGRNPGYSITGGNPDVTNTVEGVHLVPFKSYPGNLPVGTYQVNVTSQSITNPNLGFAVVVGIHNNVPRAVVMGDYTNNIKSLLEESGYMVDEYAYDDYSYLSQLSRYSLVVFNQTNNDPAFNQVLSTAGTQTGFVFLGSYPNNEFGLGVVSARTNNPRQLDQQYDLGPVKIKISGSHSITRGLGLNNIYTIINGGDNDYQSYNGFVGSQTICTNANSQGYTGMIGVVESTSTTSRRVYATSFGSQYYTNLTHWTNDGRTIFKRIVSWAGGILA